MRLLVLLLMALFLLSVPACANNVFYPALTGRVVDNAKLLTKEAAQNLTRLSEAYEKKTSAQLYIVTVTSLQGMSIEQFGKGLGNTWHIGQKDKKNGIMLIVAPHEHMVRIEVGIGLETTLSNSTCQAIIDNEIIPAFKSGNLELGITNGAIAIIAHGGG